MWEHGSRLRLKLARFEEEVARSGGESCSTRWGAIVQEGESRGSRRKSLVQEESLALIPKVRAPVLLGCA